MIRANSIGSASKSSAGETFPDQSANTRAGEITSETKGRTARFVHSLRAKLFVVLILLSFPLLVVSVLQFDAYRNSLRERDTSMVSVESAAAAGALSDWLEQHPSNETASLATINAARVYQSITRGIYQVPGMATAVFASNKSPLSIPGRPTIARDSIYAEGTPQTLTWSDGISRITTFRSVPQSGWGVAVGLPATMKAENSYSIYSLALGWGIGFAASVLLALWAAGRFTNPLRQLTTAASTLGTGRLSARANVETDDEIGFLASSFNGMASQLESQFGEIETQKAYVEETFDGLPLGIAVLDGNYVIRKANRTFSGFVNHPMNDLEGRRLAEAMPEFTNLERVFSAVKSSRKPYVAYGVSLESGRGEIRETSEIPIEVYFDLTIWPVAGNRKKIGEMFVVLSEVSKRVEAEHQAARALAGEHARAAELAGVVGQMNEGVLIVDTTKRYKINAAGMSILRRRPEEFRDGLRALIEDIGFLTADGEVLAVDQTPFWRALATQESFENERYKLRTKDGKTIVIALSATPLKSKAGTLEGSVAVFRDITEEVRTHEDLIAAYGRLKEHDRLKTAFVSTVTHELRTPLNVIIGLCQLLMRDKESPLEGLHADSVVRMERNAKSLLELVNDLIDYSRLEAGRAALELEWIDVRELAGEIHSSYLALARQKNIDLRVLVSDDLPPVLTDSRKLQRVLTKLVDNAIKFTHTGSVTIKARAAGNEFWQIEIRDTGIGISEDALGFVFDEFRQEDDRLTRLYGGAGLGLAITNKLVSLLGGTIEVKSKSGTGSTFLIKLPRVIRQRTGTGSLKGGRLLKMADARRLRSRAG